MSVWQGEFFLRKVVYFMVNFLVRTMDFLAFVTSLLAEDVMWLKNYCSSLSNWQCILFIAYCVGYVLIVKFVFILAARGIRWLLSRGIGTENMNILAFKLLCSNHAYLKGYDEGYRTGRTAREEELRRERDYARNHPWRSLWRNSKINPLNWFS